MKTMHLGLILLFVAGVVRGEPAGALEIKSYSPEDGFVKIKDGQGITNRPFSSFSAEEQQQITAWLADKIFKSSSELLIRVVEDKKAQPINDTVEAVSRHIYKGEIIRTSFDITLENRSAVMLREMDAICRIFYTLQEGEKETKCYAEEAFKCDVAPGEVKTFHIEGIELRDIAVLTPPVDRISGVGQTTGDPTIYVKDRLEGMSLRLSKEGQKGERLLREHQAGHVPLGGEEGEQWQDQHKTMNKEAPRAQRPKGTVPFRMVRLQGATFVMGVTGNDEAISEKPAHKVTLNSFEISNFEITQDQVAQVFTWALNNRKAKVINDKDTILRSAQGDQRDLLLQRTPYGHREISFMDNQLKVFGSQWPAETVTWYGAAAYCNFRSEMEGLTPCYAWENKEWECDFSANGYRLPTEAEWEYAARGGTKGENKKYSGGDDLSELGWYEKNYDNEPQPYGIDVRFGLNPVEHCVGEKAPNEVGLFDMSGNAMEWCNDWYGDYSSEPQTNPVGAECPDRKKEAYRVQRGGSWKSPSTDCRVTARFKGNPEEDAAGFRVVRRAD